MITREEACCLFIDTSTIGDTNKMSGFPNGGGENVNGSRKELMETRESFRILLNGDNTCKKDHLTSIRAVRTMSFCEKENPQVLSNINSSTRVAPTFKTFNSNCDEESGNIIKKHTNEDLVFSPETKEKKEKRDPFNNTLNHFENNEHVTHRNDLTVSTITATDTNATATAVNFYVKKPDRVVNTSSEIPDERYVSNEDAGGIGNEQNGKQNEGKNKSKEQRKEENFLVNTTCTYIKNVAASKVLNEQNSIHNQHLENVKSVTLGNWNFSGEKEKKKNDRTDVNNKNDGNYIGEANVTSREHDREKSEEIVEQGEEQREVLNDENKEKEIEGKKNYKIPFYSWIYTNHLENDILSNIYEMLGSKVMRCEERDKEINDIKNEIINMYKENLRKPLTLEYCLEKINGNKKIIEIMFYLLQNSNVINMMHDPKYNELEISDRLNMEKMNAMYKRGNDEKQDYNKKKRNKSLKEDEPSRDMCSTDRALCNKSEAFLRDEYNEQYINDEQNKYTRDNGDNNNSSIFERMSRKTREFTEEGDAYVARCISQLDKKQKVENGSEREPLEKHGTNEVSKQNRKEEEKETQEEKEEKEETEKKKEEKKEQKEKEQEKVEHEDEDEDGNDKKDEKENCYSIYTCVSCGTKCQLHYYILKPNKLKNVSFGILDKCVWCSECFISGKYPNILNSSNFVKVMKPTKSHFIKWTVGETEKLIEGIQKYKNQWDKISEHVQTKTPHECIYKFLTMPLSVPYFDVDRLLTLQKNKIPLCESNNSLLSLLTCICSYVSPYIGAYAAKKIVDTILEKQKESIVEMEQKMKTKKETLNNNTNDVETDPNVGAGVQSDNNLDISGNDTNTAVEEQSISTYILSEQEMKEIHNIVIDASKKRAKELADLEKDNLKKLLQQLVILNTKKMNLKLKQYEYIQKYLESQNQQMGNLKKET